MSSSPNPSLQKLLVSEKTRRYFFWLFILAVVAVILVWAIQPIRLWLDQRDDLSIKQQELTDIESSNTALEERAEALQTPEQIEIIARQNFGLIREGEEAYAVLPAAPEPLRIPSSWPFTELADALGG
jgi:cell division protein FtsB